jgi:hypothetical protein
LALSDSREGEASELDAATWYVTLPVASLAVNDPVAVAPVATTFVSLFVGFSFSLGWWFLLVDSEPVS